MEKVREDQAYMIQSGGESIQFRDRILELRGILTRPEAFEGFTPLSEAFFESGLKVLVTEVLEGDGLIGEGGEGKEGILHDSEV